ncbi:MAG: MBL fold metallo-hydrolase [Phycisphaerae bacterium]|nr:MBL fold metallo-hydrolase [Phycisphaerae bacterium]
MFMRMIYDDKLAEAAYLIGCQRTGEAIVIDPERDVDRYEQVAAANGLRIVAVAETHIHADFVSGGRELAEQGARMYVSDEGDADWKYQWLGQRVGGGSYDHRLLKHGDTFLIGNIEFKAVHTPGHTPEHLCFMVTDRGGGADQPMGVATGDFVFVGDLGRPDLLESAAGIKGNAESSAHRLFASVGEFMAWPDYLQLWPAHGAGSACGKALGAVPTTTVGYEKRFNPSVLAAKSEQGFVDFILDAQPEPPLYFARMKRDNKMGPRVLGIAGGGGIPKPARIGVDGLKSIDGAKIAIVDTRPWVAFKAGHLPGALHLPVNNSFNTDAGSLIAEDEPMLLIVEANRLDEAVRDLIRVGLDRFHGWCEPKDVESFAAIGGTLAATKEFSVEDARLMMDAEQPFVLDVRRFTEFREGAIDGALNIAHTRLLSRLAEVPRDRHILAYCRGGARSARACSLLARHGYDCTNMAGGMMAWEKSGPVVVP